MKADGVRLRWGILAASLLWVAIAENLAAQASPTIRRFVFFKDKGTHHLEDFSGHPEVLGISARALKRRAKMLAPGHLIDERDLPVSGEYLNQLRSRGMKVCTVSRWLNAVSVDMTPDHVAELNFFPFVSSVDVVPTSKRPELPVSSPPSSFPLFKGQRTSLFDYGPSSIQLSNMSVPEVHNLGINGSGILVGMIDDGFNNHRIHIGLKHIPVLAEYDYVQADSNTSREKDDAPGQGDHGAATMSVLAGFENGKLIGSAFGVSMILAKSEYDPTETQIELDNYVAALEWMERLGVDVVSSSLGYDDLDPFGRYNAGDITYQLKDGRTAVTSIAASVAAAKGVLLVTAMGNEGPWRILADFSKDSLYRPVTGTTGSLVTPADADSILAVGATYSDRIRADFSSTGPSADGRTKPEVVAQGTAIVAADGNTISGYYGITRSFTQGTSFSTPLTAGVAALVLSASPELTPVQVREAILNTAVRVTDTDPEKNITSWPNNWYGHGFVSSMQAVLYHGLVFSNRPLVVASDSFFTITTWIKSQNVLTADSITVNFKKPGDGTFQRALLTPSGQADQYFARVPRSMIDSTSVGYMHARDNSGAVRTNPFNAPDSLFSFAPTPDSILAFYPPPVGNDVPDDFVLHPNYPNPFNGITTILFDAPRGEEVELTVFNLLGQKIRTLLKGAAIQGTRANRATWDGSDEFNRPVPSGVYFCRLKTQSFVASLKMLHLK